MNEFIVGSLDPSEVIDSPMFQWSNLDTWTFVIAAIAVVVSVVAVVITARSAKAADESARAAKEQTEIQRQVRIDSAQPYVWADIKGNSNHTDGLDVVIGNSGPTVATNVRVDIQPPLPLAVIPYEETQASFERLREGIQALPPGRQIIWSIGDGGLIYSSSENHRHVFTIRADGPFGPVPELIYVIDIEDFIKSDARPSGSLHIIARAIEGLK